MNKVGGGGDGEAKRIFGREQVDSNNEIWTQYLKGAKVRHEP